MSLDSWLAEPYEYPDGDTACHGCRPDLADDTRDSPCPDHLRMLRDDVREMEATDDDTCPF